MSLWLMSFLEEEKVFFLLSDRLSFSCILVLIFILTLS